MNYKTTNALQVPHVEKKNDRKQPGELIFLPLFLFLGGITSGILEGRLFVDF